jgi:hypothetical protein
MKVISGQSQLVRLPLLKIVASVFVVVLVLLFLTPAGVSYGRSLLEMEGITYYVDCAYGNDGNNGTSTSTAWKSLNKANNADLNPGDKLLFKRGCTWYGTLTADWDGSSSAYITIGAYGSGNLPRFQNGATDLVDGYYNSVQIMGSYQILEYLEATITNPPVDPGCQSNPIGFFTGFNFRNPTNNSSSGSYNILRYSKASKMMAGAHTNQNTDHNKILYNTFVDNHVMDRLTPTWVDNDDDIGAWGVLLKGDHNEVGYNYFEDNNAWCTYDTPPQGNSVELYEARYNSIHHNTAINDRDFSELGGQSIKPDTNVYAYNLVISNVNDAHFIIARGSGVTWGPTYRTKLYNNTVVLTGAQSEAVICGAGCNSNIMTMRNNIIWAEQKAAFADGAFAESNNIYWDSEGDPFVQFLGFNMHASSQIANPLFVNLPQRNVRLTSNSPGINAGSSESVGLGYNTDLDNVAVPQNSVVDMGGYEFTGAPPAPTPTPAPTQTPPPAPTQTPPPSGDVHAHDTFSRYVSDGWGAPYIGGSYSYGGGSNAYLAFDVNGSTGTILLSANSGREAVLQNVNIINTDLTFRVQTDKISERGSQEAVWIARYQNSNTMYRGRIRFFGNGEVFVQAVRGVSGSWANLGSNTQVEGLTHSPNGYVWVRAQLTGTNPTTIRIKAWADGQSEPANWHYTVTDSWEALQTSGAVGLRAWLGSATNGPVRFTFDDFLVNNP